MTAGGELTVRVANRCETGGSTLLVQISDTGRGIPDGVLDNLFNPFVTTKPRGSSASPSPEASLTRIGPPWMPEPTSADPAAHRNRISRD